jgi:RNA polymerase sigma-70 factor (ECF subfamily)
MANHRIAAAPRAVVRQRAVTGRPVDADESEHLVARCQAGDRTAFQQLFVRHRGDVARLVQRMMGPVADVDDLVQEVFFQVHKSVKDFRGQARFSTWLYRVTVNVVLMQRRAAKSRPVLVETPEGLSPADAGLAPDEDAARRARMLAFGRLLEQISEKKRTVFVLHELQGLSAGEISEIVDAPVLTVRTRLFYARKELLELLRSEPTLAALADGLSSRDGGGR